MPLYLEVRIIDYAWMRCILFAYSIDGYCGATEKIFVADVLHVQH